MRPQIQKTIFTTPDQISRKWYVVDAEGKTLGRLASAIAPYLTGKLKPEYVPNLDVGDFIVVLNASKIAVTGRRLDQKFYYSYSGYPGGLCSTPCVICWRVILNASSKSRSRVCSPKVCVVARC